MNEAAHTISLTSPSKYWKSSSTFNTSNSDPTFYILRCCKWAWNSFCEWNGTRPFGPAAIHSTPKNFRTSARKFWLNGLRPPYLLQHTEEETGKIRKNSVEYILLIKMKISLHSYFYYYTIIIHDQHSDWPRVPAYFENSRDFMDKHDYSKICYPVMSAISFPEPTCLLLSTKTRRKVEIWLWKHNSIKY